MRWNPFLNAIGASGYIGAVVLLLQGVRTLRGDMPDTPFDPVIFLSLLVFSVALMGFLFFYRPVTLLLDGKRDEAVSYFLKTLGTFGATTLLLFALFSVL